MNWVKFDLDTPVAKVLTAKTISEGEVKLFCYVVGWGEVLC